MELVKDSIFNFKFDFESDVIDFNKYFGDYSKLLNSVERCQEEKCKISSLKEEEDCGSDTCKNDAFYINFLGISKEELNELKERTRVDKLTCDGEIQPVTHDFYKNFNEHKIKLKTGVEEGSDMLVSVRKRSELADVEKSELPRTFYKYCNYRWCLNSSEKQGKCKLSFDPGDWSRVVACVKVYYPFASSKNKSLRIKLLQEIHILGDQKLSQLKDKIVCSLDYIGDKDVSNDGFLKEVGVNITAKEEYPSSFIFIGNTFYNDTRTSDLVDLSKELREWASNKNIGPFDCGSMENVKICDLNIQIGRPYVYQHQGNCEHLLVFSDIRFLNYSDSSKSSGFPRIHCTGRMYGKHCMMCTDSYAKWLVVGNERLTHDKTYLCNKCFLSYNYINGQKIGKFEAYKYVDPVAIL